jgi:hypothetical protein
LTQNLEYISFQPFACPAGRSFSLVIRARIMRSPDESTPHRLRTHPRAWMVKLPVYAKQSFLTCKLFKARRLCMVQVITVLSYALHRPKTSAVSRWKALW